MEEDLSNRRNHGIDFLRIVSMLLVVILHILGQGGVLKEVQTSGRFAISWFMEIGAYCAVDCYALISGFVGFSEKAKTQKYSRYFVLWMQVVFYCVLITTLFLVLKPNVVGKGEMLGAVLPVTFNMYWYFSAYTGVFFFMPWLNGMVRNTGKRELTKWIFVILLMFSFYATAVSIVGDPFRVMGGYTFLWLAILYVIGAYIKKSEICMKIKKRYLISTGFILLVFTWGWKLGIGKLSMKLFGMEIGDDVFISYTSPTILGIALILVLLFIQVNVGGFLKKCVKFTAPAAFGVYLLHVHPLVFEYVIKGHFSDIGKLQAYLIPFAVLRAAFVVFIIGIIIDKLRGWMFKILKINVLAEKIEHAGRKWWGILIEKISCKI